MADQTEFQRRRTTEFDSLKFCLRRDLEIVTYQIGAADQLVIKDPLVLEYFLFTSLELKLIQLLSSPKTILELKSSAEITMGNSRLDAEYVMGFVRRLINDNLIVSEGFGNGKFLWQRSWSLKKNRWIAQIFNPLAIRLPGVNPRNLLNRLNPITSWLFSPVLLSIVGFLFLLAVITVILNFKTLVDSDYLWSNFGNPKLLAPIGLAIMLAKILHELGHAMACRSIGRDCDEIGVMFLAFVPCLYCNVTDIWMEPDRWKRILVSFAGIYVEMLIAAICLPLCLYCNPGLLRVFFFSMLMICSVNTLFVNGNPLLRYDGYYVLSDLVQVPNLSSEGKKSYQRFLGSMFFEQESANDSIWLIAFGLASLAYRLFVLVAILVAIFFVFDQFELRNTGWFVIVILSLLTFGVSAFTSIRQLVRASVLETVRWARLLFWGVLSAAILALLLMIPVRERTPATGLIGVEGKGIVYAPDAGLIRWNVVSGQEVESGDIIAKIESDRLAFKILQQGQLVKSLELKLENSITLQNSGADRSKEIALREQSVANAKKIFNELVQKKNDLNIVAPVDGVVLPVPQKTRLNSNAETRLDFVELEIGEVGWASSGHALALIANRENLIAKLNVSEKKIHRVAAEQSVRFIVGQLSPRVLSGTVKSIGAQNSILAVEGENTVEKAGMIDVVVKSPSFSPDVLIQSEITAVIVGDFKPIYEHIFDFLRSNFEW